VTPSWYDVLGVEETASTDEIRAAWEESIAGLAPSDRRFKQRTRAAEVLLDPDRRAAHDAELAAQDDVDDDVEDLDAAEQPVEPVDEPAPSGVALDKDRDEDADDTDGDTDEDVEAVEAPVRRRRVGWPVAVAASVVAVVLLVATVLSLVLSAGSDDERLPDERQIDSARRAAETAVGPLLSFDFRDLETSRADAVSYLTPEYTEQYERFFDETVAPNAERTKTVVTAEVLASAVVRTGEDLVDVLVFVDRPTRNASGDSVSNDQATLRMRDTDGRWLVDCLITQAGSTCGT
jgi:Mce-associated membrane protein